MDVNLNNAACVVSKEHIGYTQYVNMCNGVEKTVYWSSFDYLGILLAIGIIAFIIWFIRLPSPSK